MDLQKQSRQAQSGAADQELFIKEFEDIPKRHIYNNNSIEENIDDVKNTLENLNLDWAKRIEAMQIFRCILIDLVDSNYIINSLKDLELSFQLSLKDLRSKVVREACITVAYTSVKLQNKCEKFIENLLPLLFNLTQNSTKIMSTSAGVAIRFIIQNTHSGKFIPIIHEYLGSKSKDIRRYCCDFLNQLLRTWSKPVLEKFVPVISSSILKGLNDADAEARCFSRKAFCMFDYHFKEKANQLFLTLDSNKRKIIEKEKMADIDGNSMQCLDNTKVSKLKIQKKFIKPTIKIDTSNMILLSPVRASSSIDIGAARSATLRANLKFEEKVLPPTPMELSFHKNSNNSFKSSTQKKITSSPSKTQLVSDKQLNNNSNFRISSKKNSPLNRVCRSQPSSRSTSPNPRYINNLIDLSSPYSDMLNGTLKSRKSLIPVSSKSSICDETSPKMNINKSLTPKNYLLDSRLKVDSYMNNYSDQSEVSSLCSDKSFSDRKIDDIDEIIKSLNSIHWVNKKEGLISLENFIFNSVTLEQDHYKQLTDIFTKMLLDPNTKALSLVLSVLNKFIINYHQDLHFWLYVLLSRLFLKTGSDLLSSIQKRIIKTFDVISDSFPKNLQFNTLVQFISDNKLTPVLKVKITSLQYLLKLILQMDPSDLKCKKENQDNFQNFLMKIICWTEDKKSPQLRSLSQDIILELFNLNTPEFCNLASYLSRDYWDTAYKFMKDKNVNRKQSVDESVVFSQSFYDQILKSSFIQNEEELNHTDVFDSLMKTTEEINKYTSDLNNESFSNLKENLIILNKNNSLSPQSLITKDKYKVSYTKDDSNSSEVKRSEVNEKKTCSLDSGISQLDEATSNNNKTSLSAVLSDSTTYLSPEKQDNINNSSGSDLTTYNSFKSVNSFYVSSSSQKNESDVISEENFLLKHLDIDENEDTNEINNNSQNLNNYSNSLEDLSFNETREILKTEYQNIDLFIKNIQNFDLSNDEKKKIYEELNKFILNKENQIKKTPTTLLDKLINCILDTFDDKDLILRQLAIKTLSDLINVNQESFYLKYELVLSKIVFLNEQDYKDLNSSLQICTESISKNFCFKKCSSYLIKTINNNQYPYNEASIKILTKFIKNSDEETVNLLVPKIMPSIVRSYDNSLSSVRKFSVFCLVQLFNKVGMVIKPHLSNLDLAKIKLLKIYIDNSKPSRSSSPLLER